jgi:hypothetical protein
MAQAPKMPTAKAPMPNTVPCKISVPIPSVTNAEVLLRVRAALMDSIPVSRVRFIFRHSGISMNDYIIISKSGGANSFLK